MEGSKRHGSVIREKRSRKAEPIENVILLLSTSQPHMVSQSGAVADTSIQTLFIHSKGWLP
jgi:hypothetical protein